MKRSVILTDRLGPDTLIVLRVIIFRPIALLLFHYKNYTQPIIPRFPLTKGEQSKRHLLQSLYGGQFTLSTPFI